MPASRWNSDLMGLLSWFEDGEEIDIEDRLFRTILTRVGAGDEEGIAPEIRESDEGIPEVLPILPLRGLVVYPETAVPLTIGQPRSIRLIDDVVSEERRLIGLVASRNPKLETPGPDDLYTVGTIAAVHRLLRAPDDTIRLLVQGITRFELGEFVHLEPYLRAQIHPSPEVVEDDLEIEALGRNAREQFEQIAELIPSIPQELVESVLSLEDPLQTVYTIANFQRIELEDAQELLELDSVTEKLRKLTALLAREAEVLEIGQKIQKEARSEIEKVQHEYFLREQLKAIKKELGEGTNKRSRSKSSAVKLRTRKCRRRRISRLAVSWIACPVCPLLLQSTA